MNTAKKLFASVICLISLFCLSIVSANATEIGDKIVFTATQLGETFTKEYTCKGKMTEGINKLPADDEYAAYVFNAQKSGCYFITLDTSITANEKYENGLAEGIAECRYLFNSNNEGGQLFCLEKGETVFLIDEESNIDNTVVTIDYYGEISDIEFTSFESEKIIGQDCFIDESEKQITVYTKFKILFSSGKELYNSYRTEISENFSYTDKISEGNNTVFFCIFDFKKETVLDIRFPSDMVKSIDIDGLEDYCYAYSYYDGSFSASYPPELLDKITVTYADGTKEKCEYFCEDEVEGGKLLLTYPVEKEYLFSLHFKEENGDYYLVANLDNKEYICEKCEIIPVSFKENLDYYKEQIKFYKYDCFYSIRWYMDNISNLDIFTTIKGIFTSTAQLIKYSSQETVLFMKGAF